MIKRLAHVCLNVADIARSIAFYRDALGFPVVFRFTRADRLAGAYFKLGTDSYLELFERPPPVAAAQGFHFCLETDDMDAFIAAAAAKGIECSPKKLGGDRSWQTWLKDPDGHAFEVHQYTAESSQHTGGDVGIDR